MESLALAIEIADTADAAAHDATIDVRTAARRLVAAHPEAEIDADAVAEALRQEMSQPGEDEA